MHGTKSYTEVSLVKRDRNILVDTITNIAHHKLLKGNWLELNLFFYVFQRALQGEFLGTTVIE